MTFRSKVKKGLLEVNEVYRTKYQNIIRFWQDLLHSLAIDNTKMKVNHDLHVKGQERATLGHWTLQMFKSYKSVQIWKDGSLRHHSHANKFKVKGWSLEVKGQISIFDQYISSSLMTIISSSSSAGNTSNEHHSFILSSILIKLGQKLHCQCRQMWHNFFEVKGHLKVNMAENRILLLNATSFTNEMLRSLNLISRIVN